MCYCIVTGGKHLILILEAGKMFYEIEIEDTVTMQYVVTDRTESSKLEITDNWDI